MEMCSFICGEKGDTANIRTVIHLDIPYSPEAYLQETGRAGRDGRAVEATLLYSAEDVGFGEILGNPPPKSTGDTVARTSGVGDCPEAPIIAPLTSERYAQMLGYALDSSRCRREQLLGFLGEEPGSCSGCDVCSGRVLLQAEGEQLLRPAGGIPLPGGGRLGRRARASSSPEGEGLLCGLTPFSRRRADRRSGILETSSCPAGN